MCPTLPCALRERTLSKGKLPDCLRRPTSFRCRRQTDRRHRGVATVEDDPNAKLRKSRWVYGPQDFFGC
jgi:hypothetical protein